MKNENMEINTMKKVLFIIAIVSILALTGCGSQSPTQPQPPVVQPPASTTPAPVQYTQLAFYNNAPINAIPPRYQITVDNVIVADFVVPASAWTYINASQTVMANTSHTIVWWSNGTPWSSYTYPASTFAPISASSAVYIYYR